MVARFFASGSTPASITTGRGPSLPTTDNHVKRINIPCYGALSSHFLQPVNDERHVWERDYQCRLDGEGRAGRCKFPPPCLVQAILFPAAGPQCEARANNRGTSISAFMRTIPKPPSISQFPHHPLPPPNSSQDSPNPPAMSFQFEIYMVV